MFTYQSQGFFPLHSVYKNSNSLLRVLQNNKPRKFIFFKAGKSLKCRLLKSLSKKTPYITCACVSMIGSCEFSSATDNEYQRQCTDQ